MEQIVYIVTVVTWRMDVISWHSPQIQVNTFISTDYSIIVFIYMHYGVDGGSG